MPLAAVVMPVLVTATSVQGAPPAPTKPASSRAGGRSGKSTKPKKSPSASRSSAAHAPKEPVPWCASGLEEIAPGICYVDGRHAEGKPPRDGTRTLVIFLHGAIAEGTDWQWTQERALERQAKQSGFEAIFPRSPLRSTGYLWPGSVSDIERDEGELIDAWTHARKVLEKRNGRPFDHVFLMGFSSGAYFVSSLALRGRVDVDGFAVFAGGSGLRGPAYDEKRRRPVFVGVCANDKQTASHSRSFGKALAANGFPHRVDEQPIGHMFGDVHVAHAVTYLRGAAASRGSSSE